MRRMKKLGLFFLVTCLTVAVYGCAEAPGAGADTGTFDPGTEEVVDEAIDTAGPSVDIDEVDTATEAVNEKPQGGASLSEDVTKLSPTDDDLKPYLDRGYSRARARLMWGRAQDVIRMRDSAR